jgi:hypothetical protein
MEPRKPRLDSAIRLHLAPLLRAEGYTGSGHTYRRTVGEWIHVVNVQGSRYGGEFAVNLGLQPLGIPDSNGGLPNPKSITEEVCTFRRRMAESPAAEHQWWPHDGTEEGMSIAVRQAAAVYDKVGRRLMERATSEHSDLCSVSPEAFARGIFDSFGFCHDGSGTAFILAQMRRDSSRLDEAKAFAAHALQTAGPDAIVFISRVRAFVNNLEEQILRQGDAPG